MSRYTLVQNIIKNIQNGIFVEIGTHEGDFANFILENNETAKLYCIDPYMNYNDYDDAINHITGDQLYNKTYDYLKSKYSDSLVFIR